MWTSARHKWRTRSGQTRASSRTALHWAVWNTFPQGGLRLTAHAFGDPTCTKDPPEFVGATLDTNAFASGDTVHVEISVPANSRVQLEISPI